MPRADWSTPVPGEADALARYAPMVRAIAKRLAGFQPSLTDDMVQAAMVGAVEAIRTWRREGGAPLENHIARLAYREALDTLRSNQGAVRRPSTLPWISARLVRGGFDAARIVGDESYAAAVATALGVSAYQLSQAAREQARGHGDVSLDRPFSAARSGDRLGEHLVPRDTGSDPLTRMDVGAAFGRLPENERRVVALYAEGYTHDEISRRLGISQGRSCQLWWQGVGRLRAVLGLTERARVKGVHRHKASWRVRRAHRGREYRLGSYPTLAAAEAASLAWEREHLGEKADG